MTDVKGSWVQLAYWENSTGYGSYVSQLRLIAYSTQDTASNTSTLHFKWQKSITGGSAYWSDSHTYTVNFGGKSLSWDFAFGTVSSTSWVDCAGEKTMTVGHSDSGTLSGSFSCSGYKMWEYVTGSGTITCPSIARHSVPTCSPNPIKLSQTQNVLTVYTNRKSSSFTHTVTVTIGSHTETKYNVATSTTFNIPYSVLADFAYNSKTLNGTVTCVTNGLSGSKSCAFTASIDTDIEYPTVGTITIEDLNENTEAVEASGSLIQYASHLKATISLRAVGNYTELGSATVQCGSVSQQYVLSGTEQTIEFEYNKVDSNVLIVYVTDDRGTTNGSSESWNLVPYVDLTAVGEIHRTSETGNTIAIKLTGQCFAGSFGQATNQITVKYKSKLHSDSDFPANWTTVGTFTPSGSGATTYEYTNTLTGFDYDEQYDLMFYVEDLFTNAQTAELILTTGIPVYGNGEDFFAVYGNSFLHWDRTKPSLFWDLNGALNAILEHHAVKNLLKVTAKTTTVNGITYTVNSNGSVKVTGTATAYSSLTIGTFTAESGLSYILSGCPEGGGSRAYSLGVGSVHDYGDGATVTGTGSQSVFVDVFNGVTVNATFYPMVRDSRIASDDYVLPSIQHIDSQSVKLPSGLIIKTASQIVTHGSNQTINFSTAFPNACLFVIPTCGQLGFGSASTLSVGNITTSSFGIRNYNGASASMSVRWIAVGY